MVKLLTWLRQDVHTTNLNLVLGMLASLWLFGCIGYAARALVEGR